MTGGAPFLPAGNHQADIFFPSPDRISTSSQINPSRCGCKLGRAEGGTKVAKLDKKLAANQNNPTTKAPNTPNQARILFARNPVLFIALA